MIQETIVQLISKAGQKEVPMFMVGDMKQSIYRFRQADPSIFKEKYDTFNHRDDASRVDLVFNYRSNKIVLDSINFIFDQIMDSHYGQLEYLNDPSAQLNYDFLRKEGCQDTSEYEVKKAQALTRISQADDLKTEILLFNHQENLEITDEEYEARMIANRILEIMNSDLKLYGRPIQFEDFVVLMRSTTQFLTYKKIFDAYGIPSLIVLSQGFMSSVEIRQMMNVYRMFANPYDEMAVMSCLRAPFLFSNLSEMQISQARVAYPELTLFEALKKMGYTQFYEAYDDLSHQLKEMDLAEWTLHFYEVSGYLNFCRNLRNGQARFDNLLLLVDHIQANLTQANTVNEWVNYFDRIDGENMSPAVSVQKNTGVQFMTIHKSKGLEFPIVFVAMHHKHFNLQDSKERMILDKDLTLALKPRRLMNIPLSLKEGDATFKDILVEYNNPFLYLMSLENEAQTRSEEMRIYYVALTRASEKLILTGCIKNDQLFKALRDATNQDIEDMYEAKESQHIIFNRNCRKANSYMDWLLPSVFRHPHIISQLQQMFADDEKLSYLVSLLKPCNIQSDNVWESKFSIDIKEANDLLLPTRHYETMNVSNQFDYHVLDYPYESEINLAKSVAVTSLEGGKFSLEVYAADDNKKMAATDRGTLVHEFMEHFPLEEAIDFKSLIDSRRYYSDLQKEVLYDYIKHFEVFRESDCFKWMKNALKIYREQPFCMKYGNQILHGTIDVFFENEEVIRIVDWKTDKVKSNASDELLASMHQKQLELYASLLRKLKKEKKVEAYLYYLEIDRLVQVV